MKIKMLIMILFVILFSPYCIQSSDENRNKKEEFDQYINSLQFKKEKQFKNYSFNPSSSIVSRCGNAPDFVLKYLKEYDNVDYYQNYVLTNQDKKLIEDTFKLLPPLIRKSIQEKVVGIYFIEGYKGQGFTEWIVDEKTKELYYFITFNSYVFKKNLSDSITEKVKTCFIPDQDHSIKINCGTDYSGLLYIMLHEGAHVVDYTYNITPYVEEVLHYYQKNTIDFKHSKITDGVWKSYSKPTNSNDFPLRKEITFYGFSNGPKLKINQATDIYQQLSKTAFLSLYSTKIWAEDLAELLTFYHLTMKMNCPYKIEVYKKNKMIYSLEPMKIEKVKKRFKPLEQFYQE